MQLVFEDRNRQVVSDKETISFSSSSAFHLFAVKIRAVKNFVLSIDGKETFRIKPSRELQIIYLATFLGGKNHTLSLERKQKNGSLTLENLEIFVWQPNTSLTLEVNDQAEDGDRRSWVTCVLNNFPLVSFAYTVSYSRRKRDSDDVKIVVDNNVQGSLLKTIKYKLWRLVGSFLPLYSPTKTEIETINVNPPQQLHVIEFIADRTPILHSLTLNFGPVPVPPNRIPTADDPKWTGNFADDPDQIILARALFGEARNTLVPDEARIAIGWVIKNRVKSGKETSTYCEVITKPLQFSSFNVGDPNRPYVENPLYSGNTIDKNAWAHAYEIAGKIINDELSDPTIGANHYYDDSISAPDWAANQKPTLTITYVNEYEKTANIFFLRL